MDQKILREYLVALGFHINQTQSRQMDKTVERLDFRFVRLGKIVAGLAAGIVTTTTIFAKQMEKLYYSSRYADSTASRMQALEYGARGIGLEAGEASAALKSMAEAIRSNPGFEAILNGLGITTKGRDMVDVLSDFVGVLKKMPFHLAQQYAAMFGIAPETLYNLIAGHEKLKKEQEEHAAMARQMGVDTDKATEAAKEYMDAWRQITERFKMVGQIIMIQALEPMRELAQITNKMLQDWGELATKIPQAVQVIKDLKDGKGIPKLTDAVPGLKEANRRITAADNAINGAIHKARDRLGEFLDDLTGESRKQSALRLSEGQKVKPRPPVPPFSREADNRRREFEHSEMSRKEQYEGLEREWRIPPGTMEKLYQNSLAQGADGRSGTRPLPWAGPDAERAQEEARKAQEAASKGKGWQTPKEGINPPSLQTPGKADEDLLMRRWEYLSRLESQWGLPEGVLDRVWRKESGRGKNQYNPRSKAAGPFQFIPPTAAEYGLEGNEVYDFERSADAAAMKWRGLLKLYKGNEDLAAAAWNWGEGNMQKYLRGKKLLPRETQDFVREVTGGDLPRSVNQETTIYVNGESNPRETAQRVIEAQREVNSDLIRNYGGQKVR